MIKVNKYLDGKVVSLGFELDGNRYTTGVFSPGEYSVPTEVEEHVTVTLGGFEIRISGKGWKSLKTGDKLVIPAGSNVDYKVGKPASYVCLFK